MLQLAREHDFQVFLSPCEALPACTNPPAFTWPSPESSHRYTFELIGLDSRRSLVRETVGSPVLLETTLPPGAYQWRVIDESGETSDWYQFSLTGEEPEYLPPTAQSLFEACEEWEQWILYPDADLGAVREAATEHLPRLRATAKVAMKNQLPEYPNHYRSGRERYKRLAIHQVREWVDRDLMVLCLLYRIDGDVDAGKAAVDRLLTLAEWSTDGPASLLRPCRWGDEVGLSLARNVFIAYHWLRPLLSEGERIFTRSLLVRVAEQAYRRLEQDDFLQMPGHSHTSRLPGYLGVAALVLHKEHDPEQCRQWLEYALKLYQGVLPFYGGADGGWAEGPFYAASYSKWFHPFFLTVERLSGFSFYQHPFYVNHLNYCRDFVVTDNDLHPFGDGFWCHPDGKEWPGFFAQNPLRIYAERFGSAEDIARSRELEQAISIYSLHLLDVIPTRDQMAHASKPRPVSGAAEGEASVTAGVNRHERFYRHAGHGIAAFDRLELRFRCSHFGNSSHRHADQGNLSLIDAGSSILCPTGSYGFAFGSRHHREWTRTTRAHNLPLIDGTGQLLDDPDAVGRLLSTSQSDDAVVRRMDLSAAYAADIQFTRTLILLRDAGLVIVDDINATTPIELDWCLHSAMEASLADKGVQLHSPGNEYTVRLDSHPQVAPQLAVGYAQEDEEEQNIIDSDARHDATHMTWRLGPARCHRVIASCSKMPVRVLARDGMQLSWGQHRFQFPDE